MFGVQRIRRDCFALFLEVLSIVDRSSRPLGVKCPAAVLKPTLVFAEVRPAEGPRILANHDVAGSARRGTLTLILVVVPTLDDAGDLFART